MTHDRLEMTPYDLKDTALFKKLMQHVVFISVKILLIKPLSGMRAYLVHG